MLDFFSRINLKFDSIEIEADGEEVKFIDHPSLELKKDKRWKAELSFATIDGDSLFDYWEIEKKMSFHVTLWKGNKKLIVKFLGDTRICTIRDKDFVDVKASDDISFESNLDVSIWDFIEDAYVDFDDIAVYIDGKKLDVNCPGIYLGNEDGWQVKMGLKINKPVQLEDSWKEKIVPVKVDVWKGQKELAIKFNGKIDVTYNEIIKSVVADVHSLGNLSL